MAHVDPQSDPAVEQQLYADLGPNLGDAMPIPVDTAGLWAPWAPDHWFSRPGDHQLAHVGPGGAPPGSPAGLPATAAPAPDAGPPVVPDVPPMPPMHPADLAASDITLGPPEPLHLPYGLGDVPTIAPPPPAPTPTVAESPDITIRQEPPSAAIDVARPGGPALPPPPTYGPPLPPAEQHYRQSLQDYAGSLDQIPDPVERQRALNELYGNPARAGEAAVLETRRAQEARDMFARRHDELMRGYAEAQTRAFDDWQASQKATEAKMNATMADVQRIANTKVDPMGGMSPLQRVAGVVAAIVGGLYQGRVGAARNPGLDALNDIINRHVAEQKEDLARQLEGGKAQMNLLGQEYARHGDMYRAEQVMRMGMYQMAEQELAVQQQNYTPGGTKERELAKARVGAQAAAANLAFETAKKFNDEEIKNREQARKEAETGATILEKRSATAKNWKEIDKLTSEIGENQPLTQQQIQQQFPQLPPAAIPPGGMSQKALEKHLEIWNKATTAANADSATILRSPVTFEPLPSSSKGGGVARAGDATIAGKGNEMLSETQRFIETLASIKRELAADPSTFDRQKFEALQSEYNVAKEHFIKSLGSNYTNREVKAVDDMFGPGFNSYTDRFINRGTTDAKMDALIKDAISTGENLAGTQYGVKAPRDAAGHSTLFKNPLDQPTPAPSAAEQAATRLNTNVWHQDYTDVPMEDRPAWKVVIQGPAGAQNPYWKTAEGMRVAQTGLSPSQLAVYDRLDADARGADPAKRDEALTILGKQAESGPHGAPTSAQREYARALLQKVVDRGMESMPIGGP